MFKALKAKKYQVLAVIKVFEARKSFCKQLLLNALYGINEGDLRSGPYSGSVLEQGSDIDQVGTCQVLDCTRGEAAMYQGGSLLSPGNDVRP